METINHYILSEPLKNDNSGFSKWGFAQKDGKEFFLKEFLSPVYPADASLFTEESYSAKIAFCERFEREKCELYEKINAAARGNLVRIEDFFRWGTHYYIVTNKVSVADISAPDVAKLPIEQRLMIGKIVSHAMNCLHSSGVVHGDIKPENILLRKTPSGKYGAKVIDFDCSYMESDPPDIGNESVRDILYTAPENFLRMMGEDRQVGTASDIFSLGVVFSIYFTGSLPRFSDAYDYPYEAALDGQKLTVDAAALPGDICEMLESMLLLEPEKRPTASDLFDFFSGGALPYKIDEKPPIPPVPMPSSETTKKTVEQKQVDRWFKTAGEL